MNYTLHKSQYIIDNADTLSKYVDDIMLVYGEQFSSNDANTDDIQRYRNTKQDSTSLYNEYNALLLLRNSKEWNTVFDELLSLIKGFYTGSSSSLYLKCWINYHNEKSVLNWHNHSSLFHGYMSIRPNNTITQFETVNIENQVGNIYIGPGGAKHRVLTVDKFDQPRITLAFDVNESLTDLNNPFIQVPILL